MKSTDFLSLDIETTGLNERADSIWAIAMQSKGKNIDLFISDQNKDVLKRKILETEFGGKTYSGVPQFEEFMQKSPTSIQSGVDQAFRAIDNRTVLLVQNLNFENKFFDAALAENPNFEEHASKFRYYSKTTGGETSRKLLYAPPQVGEARALANRAHVEFMRGTGDFSEVARLNEEMMKLYKSAIHDTVVGGKGAITVELMDITRATFAQAAQQGYMGKADIGIGTNVDFLSRMIYGSDMHELHLAKEDAVLQGSIATRLLELQERMGAGSLDQNDLSQLARISAGQRDERVRQFLSSVRNSFEELETQGWTKVSAGDSPGTVGVSVLDRSSPGAVFETTVPQAISPQAAADPKNAWMNAYIVRQTGDGSDKLSIIEDVIYRHGGVPEGLNPDGIAEQIMNDRIKIGDSESSIYDAAEVFKRRASDAADASFGIGGGATGGGGGSGPPPSASSAGQNDGYFSRLKKLPGRKKVAVGAVIAAGVAASLALTGDDDTESRSKRIKKSSADSRDRQSLDRQLRQFRAPEVYHGTPLANWKERKRHHEY